MLRLDAEVDPVDLNSNETADAISAILQESCANPFETQQLYQATSQFPTQQLVPFIDVNMEADLIRRDEALIQRTHELEKSRTFFQHQQQTLLDEKAAFKLSQDEAHRLAADAKEALMASEADLVGMSVELDTREEQLSEREDAIAEREDAIAERESSVVEREAQHLGTNDNNRNQRRTLWGKYINRTSLIEYSTISLVNIAHRDMCRSLSLSKEVALRAVERSEGVPLGSRFFEDSE
jgi:hypothetical protein